MFDNISMSRLSSSAEIFLSADETMLKSPRSSLITAVIFLALLNTSTDCVYGLYLTMNGRLIVSA